MKPGYSKVLIHDYILPAQNALQAATFSDIYMMSLFSAAEKTEYQFRSICESVGLEVTGIWKRASPEDTESVIEVVLYK